MTENSNTKNFRGRISEIFIGIYFFTSSIAIGQAKYIEGQVLNISDSISISDVHFFDSVGKLLAVADYYGDFQIFYEENIKISASCIGYKTRSFNISSLNTDSIIWMSEDTVKLNELLISPLSARGIILKSIEKIESYYLDGGIKTIGNFNLIVKQDDQIIYNESRRGIEINMNGPDYFPSYLKRKPSIVQNNSDSITSEIFHEYLDEINNVFLFDHIIHKRGFLNPYNLEMWDFKIDGYTFYDDKNVIVIRTKLIDHLENTLHESKIFINEEDYGILKLDFKYQWKKRSFIKTNIDSLWIDDLVWKGRANYIKDGDTYSLSYLDYSNEKIVCTRDLMRKFIKLYKYEILSDFTSGQ